MLTPACRRRRLWCLLQMWPGLIQKAKDGGLDVIETYVFWDIHEPVRGQARRRNTTTLHHTLLLVYLLSSFFLTFPNHLLLLATIMSQRVPIRCLLPLHPMLYSHLFSAPAVPLLLVPCLLPLLFQEELLHH
jgi:hypothetical protein